MIQIKDAHEIAKMRAAGLVVAHTLQAVRVAVAPGISTAELDALAESSIRGAGAVPSFKGYHGFPGSICASVNEEIVHGIPRADAVLREGDLISIDCGAILNGWHGDSAITVCVGEASAEQQALMDACEDSMWAGFAAGRVGGRLTDISHGVEQAVRAAGSFGIVDHYGGHGIGTEMHQDPHVLNHGRPGRGPKLVEGLALAIEPMITLGAPETQELADGWTVVTQDGSLAAHFEHTVAFTDDGVWVLTALDGGRTRLGDQVTARQKAA